MSNGFFSIAGTQTAAPNEGSQILGPFSVNFSAVIAIVPVTVNTSATVPVPAGAHGVFVIPPLGNLTPTLVYKTTSGDTGLRINPGNVTYHDFDLAAVPANVYLVSGSSVPVVLQFV